MGKVMPEEQWKNYGYWIFTVSRSANENSLSPYSWMRPVRSPVSLSLVETFKTRPFSDPDDHPCHIPHSAHTG